ncbi:MAG: DUF3052 family protein [Rhizobiaceae bacterium]|nr:DUF3052 family protein [Rhizobiaceae bacterium]
MAVATAGYSGKPLAAKLGFKEGMVAAFVALPPSLDSLPDSVSFGRADRLHEWRDLAGIRGPYDAIHAFTRGSREIEAHLPDAQSAIVRAGMIWVSWPKKASKVATDVTEDAVRREALKLDLVDVKVAAIDETWSGLKLVIRKDRR